jgi:hypothetical protein
MKRFFLYTIIWSPGALAVIGYLIAINASRRVDAGEISYMQGHYTVLPWVWMPGFLLLPAAFLGFILLFSLFRNICG